VSGKNGTDNNSTNKKLSKNGTFSILTLWIRVGVRHSGWGGSEVWENLTPVCIFTCAIFT